MEIWKRERREDDQREVEDGDQLESQLPNLPQEIITDILLRLPAMSLGRFRCVSKLFLSLLSDPRFTKTHLHRSLHNVPFRSQNQRLLLSSHNLYSVGYESVCGKGDENGCVMGVEIDYPLKHESNLFSQLTKQYAKRKFHNCRRSCYNDVEYLTQGKFDSIYKRNNVYIEGSCNGLVCIHPAQNVRFLFNPTTREWKRLPEVPEILNSDEPHLDEYGFGYDSVHDDYKVIKLNDGYDITGAVYSLRTDSWKDLGNPPYCYGHSFYSTGCGLSFKGAIHWFFGRKNEEQSCVIAAFDLSKDEFWDMPLPDEVDCRHSCGEFNIGILNESLCIIYNCYQMHDDIWLMREYGVGSSWTRLRIGFSYKSMYPLCSDENGEILLNLYENLFFYNFENRVAREVKICGVRFIDGFKAMTYVESLISPVLYGRD